MEWQKVSKGHYTKTYKNGDIVTIKKQLNFWEATFKKIHIEAYPTLKEAKYWHDKNHSID